jgi:hypothetical protein
MLVCDELANDVFIDWKRLEGTPGSERKRRAKSQIRNLGHRAHQRFSI